MNKLSLLFSTVLLCLAGLTLTAAAQAQDFPNKPITIVAPFPAGGTTDIIARSLADKMRGPLKQSVLVENRPGAASLLALNYVRSKPADGYTMVMMSTTITTLWSLASSCLLVLPSSTSCSKLTRVWLPFFRAVRTECARA